VFVIVHRKLAEFEHRAAIRTWLYRICQRAASDYRKRAHVRREVTTGEVIERGQVDGRAVVDGAETRAVLQRALDLLDEDKRTVFVLFEIEGFGMKEVATIVGCPLQTAYSRLHAARRILSEAVIGLREGVA
jgi:RNA polymerase sigma-70 factor (ECF subfamily)